MAFIPHALISTNGSAILKYEDKESTTVLDKSICQTRGKPYWLPLIKRGPRPSYDPATHHAPLPTEVINDTDVTQSWATAVAKTTQEIEDEKVAESDSWVDLLQTKLITKLLVALFMQENEIRTLKGQGSVTVAQFIDGLANLPDPSREKLRDLIRAVGSI